MLTSYLSVHVPSCLSLTTFVLQIPIFAHHPPEYYYYYILLSLLFLSSLIAFRINPTASSTTSSPILQLRSMTPWESIISFALAHRRFHKSSFLLIAGFWFVGFPFTSSVVMVKSLEKEVEEEEGL